MSVLTQSGGSDDGENTAAREREYLTLSQLRARHKFKDLRDLVILYNATDKENADFERNSIYTFLRFICLRMTANQARIDHPEHIMEFASIGLITVQSRKDEDLFGHALNVFKSHICIDKSSNAQSAYAAALVSFLENAVSGYFNSFAKILISLGETLIDALKVDSMNMDRSEFKRECILLLALQKTAFVLERYWHPTSQLPEDPEFLKNLKTFVHKVKDRAQYYPYIYHATIIEECTYRRPPEEAGSNIGLASAAFTGIVYSLKAVCNFALGELDRSSIEGANQSFQEATQRRGWASWSSALFCLINANLRSLKDEGRIEQFSETYKAVMSLELNELGQDVQRALRYGIIYQLQIAAVNRSTKIRRYDALDLLKELATDNSPRRWREDGAILEALFDALIAAGAIKDNEKRVRDTIQQMRETARAKIDQWLGSGTIEDLIEKERPEEQEPLQESLVDMVFEKAGYTVNIDAERTNMKKSYTDNSTATVTCAEKSDSSLQVKDLNNMFTYHGIDYQNQPREQLQKVDTDELIDQLASESFEKPVCMTIQGYSGSGKTTVAKRVGIEWAEGKLVEHYDDAFVLLLRDLLKEESPSRHGRFEDRLVAVITKLCFRRHKSIAKFDTLCNHVEILLGQARTLLVIDDLDMMKNKEKLLEEVKKIKCTLLLLRDSHEKLSLRSGQSIYFECDGLSTEQLKTFFEQKNKTEEGARSELLQDLANSMKCHPMVQEVIRLPFNACYIANHITTDEALFDAQLGTVCPYTVVSALVRETWRAYSQKFNKELEPNAAYELLGKIATTTKSQKPQNGRKPLLNVEPTQEFNKEACLEAGLLVKKSNETRLRFKAYEAFFSGHHMGQELHKGDQHDFVKDRLSGTKYQPDWNETLVFAVQELGCLRSLGGVKRLFRIIDLKPKALVPVHALLLKLKLLDVFLVTDDGTTSNKIENGVGDDKDIENIVADLVKSIEERKHDYEFLEYLTDQLKRMPRIFRLLQPTLKEALQHLSPETVTFDQLNNHGRKVKVICQIPDYADKFIEQLKNVCKSDCDDQKKCKALKLVATVITAVPRRSLELVQFLYKKIDAENGSIAIAKTALKQLIRFSSDIDNDLRLEWFQKLKSKSEKEERDVRCLAIQLAGHCARNDSSLVTDLLELLHRIADNSQDAIMLQLSDIEIRSKDHAKQYLDLLQKWTQSENIDVQKAAFSQISHAFKSKSFLQFKDDLLQLYDRGRQHTADEVRITTLEQLSIIATTGPKDSKRWITIFHEAIAEKTRDREVVIAQLHALYKALPTCRKQILEKIEDLIEEQNDCGCTALYQQKLKILADYENWAQLCELFKDVLTHSSVNIKLSCLKTDSDILENRLVTYREIIERLFEACQSDNDVVKERAQQCLRKLSPEDLLTKYKETENEYLQKAIVQAIAENQYKWIVATNTQRLSGKISIYGDKRCPVCEKELSNDKLQRFEQLFREIQKDKLKRFEQLFHEIQ